MKVFRGPRCSSRWRETDSKTPSVYAKKWRPGQYIAFDGTIEKGGNRHSDIGVEIDREDVLALHGALIEHFKSIEQERDSLLKTVERLEEGLLEIRGCGSWHRSKAPNDEAVIAAVVDLADHFLYHPDRLFRSKHQWLDFETK